MFWTEIGNVVKIERAGMDGSQRRAVVNSSLGWPGGVAVDTISDRVYWTDERLRSIGSATLDGDDIRVKQPENLPEPVEGRIIWHPMCHHPDPQRKALHGTFLFP